MKFFRSLAVVLVVLLACVSAFGQGSTTGQLVGTVTTGGNPLPGATVTITSPSMQGSRTAVSDVNGNFSLSALPPGDYTVKIELSGLQTVNKTVHVGVSSTSRADADLKVSAVAEAITVTASAPAVLETTEVQANYQKKLVDQLPLSRTVTGIALLAPGVTANGPRAAVQISGSFANDNLINVDGSNVQENLRGQARPLFIEDAVQETTVMSAGVSAEYGRFTGGVINAITKSGGNEFSGSFRDSLDNPAWTTQSAFGEAKSKNNLNNTYEATLGGRIIRDRLWFFGAGRYAKSNSSIGFFRQGGTEVLSESTNQRTEAKLTGQVTAKHSLQVTYLRSPLKATNNNQIGFAWEQAGLDPSINQAEDFKSAHYNGILTNNLLIEGNWSNRRFTFIGFGGDNPDLYLGTPLIAAPGFSTRGPLAGVANAPYFCGICDNERRDNTQFTGKATYFLGTKALGTHNLVGGLEQYKEFRLANNFQSPTNLTVWMYATAPKRNPDGSVTYTYTSGTDDIEYYPVEIPSIGSDLKTRSAFVNDKWDLSSHFSFNLGGRYDVTTAVDSAGNKTADESTFSPRLGVIYDVAGNGRIRVNATYGKYVGRLAETVQGAGSNAGEPAAYYYYYEGPTVSGTSAQVVRAAIDWLKANRFTSGQPDKALADVITVGGFSTRLAGKLKSPDMREYTLGAGFQVGPNGYFRADYIDRDWNNYYSSTTNQTTSQVTEPRTGAVADLTLVGNTDLFDRKYKAVQMQAQYRFFQRLNLGANYTYSTLKGNAEGEGTAGGPTSEGGWIFQYPEYQGFAQNRPSGYLSGDQRHKLRAWASMDFALGPVGRLNVSALERFDSGLPYSAVGSIPRCAEAQGAVTGTGGCASFASQGKTAPKYAAPPTNVTYYFSKRGEFRTDDISRTDLAVNYTLPISRAELFVETEVFNLFNQQKVVSPDTTIITRSATSASCTVGGVAARCVGFNPFLQTPVEGLNYVKGPDFGKAIGTSSYQLARTYQLSVGVRF
jgi:outer membrane receptor for ferrienterochelin and colicin